MGNKIVTMNPMGYPPQIDQLGMAPRLDTLEGKNVYLIDVRFDDSDRFLRQMQNWFSEHMSGVHTTLVSKSGVYNEDDPALLSEIADRGDAVIVGVGH